MWKHRFHIDKMTMAGHSFGAATVVEVLRHTERFTNVQAGIIYDIWGAPIKPPADDPKHRIHLPLLGISSEAFMYWEKNWDALMSLMREASEHGAPAYLLTVRGSIHISQSDFSILYKHASSFFMKATVHPQRAIDLNVSTSLEFLRLVTPESGGGKSIIARCMTNEKILETPLLEDMPDDHRPDDQWIAARLRVDHEFRKRLAAGVQRKIKRNFQGGMGTGYTTSDEMWCFFKPSEEELRKWVEEEERGEKRIDEDRATASTEELKDKNHPAADASLEKEGGGALRHDDDLNEALRFQKEQKGRSEPVKNRYDQDEKDTSKKGGDEEKRQTEAADKNEKPADTWLGVLPALKGGPGQGSK
jgi:platelet-activating factor acetylhydrolase